MIPASGGSPAHELEAAIAQRVCSALQTRPPAAARRGRPLGSGKQPGPLPRHGADIGPYLINKILKDPGIEKEKK